MSPPVDFVSCAAPVTDSSKLFGGFIPPTNPIRDSPHQAYKQSPDWWSDTWDSIHGLNDGVGHCATAVAPPEDRERTEGQKDQALICTVQRTNSDPNQGPTNPFELYGAAAMTVTDAGYATLTYAGTRGM
jgi:hypothetical protein